MTDTPTVLANLIRSEFEKILEDWLRAQSAADVLRPDILDPQELRRQAAAVLRALQRALDICPTDQPMQVQSEPWEEMRGLLAEFTEYRVDRGFAPREMAMFILSLKQPIFDGLRSTFGHDSGVLIEAVLGATQLLDQLGLYTTETYIAGREDVIRQQQSEMIELSTPVVQLWDQVVALPLIGTMDSMRAQMVMENLLQAIVDRQAEFAIIDITGVPTVDTLVAQHLIKTAAAVRLLGATCIISGIRPQIAQTIVHLGVDLPEVITRSDLQSALAYALRQTGVRLHRSDDRRSDDRRSDDR